MRRVSASPEPVADESRAATSWASVRRAMGASMVHQTRWRIGAGAAWIVGAVAGVAPVALFGDRAPGLVAAAALGAIACAWLAPLIVGPLVAVSVCDDDALGAAPYWHVIGVGWPVRLAARTVAAAGLSLRLFPVAAAGAATAALGSSFGPGGHLVVGISGAPGPAALALGAVTLVVAWTIGALVGAAAVTPARAGLWLAGGVAVTGLAGSLVYFVATLRFVFWAMPAAALWPFDPESFDSAQFAMSVPLPVRLVSGTAWLTVLAALAWRRRHRDPYPTEGERGHHN